ncbi:MAG: chemotaxis protein CheX [Granulosicoccus sp.]
MSAIAIDELQEIVEVVWMTVLELPVEPCVSSELASTEALISEIRISGAWQGVVAVRASMQFLRNAASLMFSIDASDVQHLDCKDTLSELTNMLGGTVKCLLPEVCDLSLPSIETCDTVDIDAHDWINFNCQNHPLAVAVTQDAEGSQAAA